MLSEEGYLELFFLYLSASCLFFCISFCKKKKTFYFHGLETLMSFYSYCKTVHEAKWRSSNRSSCPWWAYSEALGYHGNKAWLSAILPSHLLVNIFAYLDGQGEAGEKPVFTEGLGDSQTICATCCIFFGVSWLTSFGILQLASHFLHNFKFFPKHSKSHFNTIELGICKFTMISSHLLFLL